MNHKMLVSVKFALISMLAVLALFSMARGFSTGKAASSPDLADLEIPPIVTAITPDTAVNDLDAEVVISGSGFVCEESDTSGVKLPVVTLNDISLKDVTWVSDSELTAKVPWGLEPGTYTVTVTNPDGGAGSLAESFTVTQGIGVWTSGGPYGGAVSTLLINPDEPNTLYASVPSGIGLFRSNNGGENWELIVSNLGGHFHDVDLSMLEPSVIYLHKRGDGLHRSEDGGDSWVALTVPDQACFGLRPFTHPTDPETVYMTADCPNSGGIYKSNDRGVNWKTLNEELSDTHVTALAFSPDDPRVMYAGTAGGYVFHSTNGGDLWTEIGRPDNFISSLAVNPIGNHEPWAPGADDMGHFGYLWKYVESKWEQVMPGEVADNNATSILFSLETPGMMWISTQGGGFRSPDSGLTWESLAAPSGGVNTLAVDPHDLQVIYLGYNGTGIAKTVDGGVAWSEINQGLAGVYPTGLAIHPDDPATVYTTAHGTGTFKTNNAGDSWIKLPSENLITGAPWVDLYNQRKLYVGAGGDICYTEDDGIIWNCVTPDLPPAYMDCCGPELLSLTGLLEPGHLLIGMGFVDRDAPSFEFIAGGIYLSTDDGGSWQYVDVGAEIAPVTTLAIDPSNPEIIYAGTDNRTENYGTGIWKSMDGGVSWAPSGLSQKRITGIVVDPSNSQNVYATSLQDFYISNDAGVTWTLRPTQDTGVDKLLMTPSTPAAIYRYGWGGMLRSLDGGLSWERAAGPLGYADIGSMAATTLEGRVMLYVGMGSISADELDEGALRLAATDDSLISAGVYRNIFQTADLFPHLYLPAVRK